MPTFKLTLAYDGTNFSGWQFQPQRRTVQGVLRTAWEKITGEAVQTSASSRTDAGVHARRQVVGVRSQTHLTPDVLFRAINANLPEDVVLVDIEFASEQFHATHHAIGKHYRYSIHNDRTRPLFERDFFWHVPKPLDTDAMQRAGQLLVGTHDFTSFQSAGSERESTVRTITFLAVERGRGDSAGCVEINIEGGGFLYNMVRIIVGSLVDVGLGRRDPSWLAEVLAARDRRVAGKTAPPQGLCLMRVDYPPGPALSSPPESS